MSRPQGTCVPLAAQSYSRRVARIEVLRPFVEQTLARYLGLEKVQVWEDGTIPIRAGSTVVNVRLVEGEGDKPLLQVYSPLVHEIERTPALLERLNEMNTQMAFTRAFWANRQVILAMDLLAETLDEEQVSHACSYVSLAADHWDEALKKDFGGELFFDGERPAEDAEKVSGEAPTPSGKGLPEDDEPPTAGYI